MMWLWTFMWTSRFLTRLYNKVNLDEHKLKYQTKVLVLNEFKVDFIYLTLLLAIQLNELCLKQEL